jgi:hypothetical protein
VALVENLWLPRSRDVCIHGPLAPCNREAAAAGNSTLQTAAAQDSSSLTPAAAESRLTALQAPICLA